MMPVQYFTEPTISRYCFCDMGIDDFMWNYFNWIIGF